MASPFVGSKVAGGSKVDLVQGRGFADHNGASLAAASRDPGGNR